MEGYEAVFLTGGGLAVMLAFIKALKGAYQDWQVRRITQGDGPAGGRGHWPHLD